VPPVVEAEKLPVAPPKHNTFTMAAGVIVNVGHGEQEDREAILFITSVLELPSVTRIVSVAGVGGGTVVPVPKVVQVCTTVPLHIGGTHIPKGQLLQSMVVVRYCQV
jgi:hypothetical protein